MPSEAHLKKPHHQGTMELQFQRTPCQLNAAFPAACAPPTASIPTEATIVSLSDHDQRSNRLLFFKETQTFYKCCYL